MAYRSEDNENFYFVNDDGSQAKIEKNKFANNPEQLESLKAQYPLPNQQVQPPAPTKNEQIVAEQQEFIAKQPPSKPFFGADSFSSDLGTPSQPKQQIPLAPAQPENLQVPDQPQPFQQPQPSYSVIPGQFQESGRQTTSLGADGKAALNSLQNNVKEQQKAVDLQTKALEADNLRKQGLIDGEFKRQEAERIAAQGKEVERQKTLKAEQDKYQSAVDDAAKFEFKDYFENNSKVLASIAIGLGQFGAGLTGGQNTALQIIESNIARDLERQKLNYQKLRDKTETQKSVYGMLRDRLGDERQADTAFMQGALQASINKINIIQGSTSNEVIKSNGEKVKADLQGKMLEKRVDAADRITSVQQRTPDRVVRSDGSELKPQFKDGKEFIEAVGKDDDIKKLKEKTNQQRELKALVDSGASKTAKAKFIADYLKQGSYGPDFERMLNERGLVGSGLERAKQLLKGGADDEQINSMMGALQKDIEQTRKDVQPKLDFYKEQSQMFGIKAESVLGKDLAGEKQGDINASLGFTPKKK